MKNLKKFFGTSLFLLVGLFFLVLSPAFGSDVQAQKLTMEQLEEKLFTSADNFIAQSEALKTQLMQANVQVKNSQLEVTNLVTRLDSTLNSYTNLQTSYIELKTSFNHAKQFLIIMGIVLLAMMVLKIILNILQIKGIKVPYILAVWL